MSSKHVLKLLLKVLDMIGILNVLRRCDTLDIVLLLCVIFQLIFCFKHSRKMVGEINS